jgi:hypothetical protein
VVGCQFRRIWPIVGGGGMKRVRRNINDLGIIKLSAVNNSMNKRRKDQLIVCR